MLSVRAKIKLYKGDSYRKTPFLTGYRPLFTFVDEMKKSGKITLIDKDKFTPGDEGEVKITFLDNNYLGSDFGNGKSFTFSEGTHILGEGKVLEIIH
jgi:elongation factor Tu